MRLTQMDAILIRILYLSAAGIVFATVLGLNAAASALFALTFPLVALLWLSGATRQVHWTDALLILTAGLALWHIVMNASAEGTGITLGYFKKYAMFITTLVYFQAACKLRIDRGTEKFLLALASVLAVFFAAVYASGSPLLYMIRGRISNYLTFGFTNPNLAALFLVCVFTCELISVFQSRGAVRKLWHILLAAALCFFVWKTESRNCLLTILLETVLCGFLHLRKRGLRLPRWFSFLTAVWPLLFVGLYFVFVDNGWIQETFAFIVDEGKGLDSRLAVWRPALYYYEKSPIWGAYSQISRGTGASQMHNTHLDMLVSYGTVPLILVCVLLYRLLRSGAGETKEETMARICFSAIIIMGMGEAALFSGGLGIYLFAGMALLLCGKQREEQEKQE